MLSKVVPAAVGLLLVAISAFQEPRPLDPVRQLQFAVIIALGAAVVIAYLKRPGQSGSRMLARPLWMWLGVFTASAAVSFVASPHSGYAIVRTSVYVALLLAGIALCAVYSSGRWSTRNWYIAIALSGLPFLAFAFVDMFTGSGRAEVFDVGVYLNVRHVGSAGFLVAAAATALGATETRARIPAFIITTFALAAVMASGSRGALLFWLVFTGGLVILLRNRRRVFWHSTIAVAVSAGVVWTLHTTAALNTADIFSRVAIKIGSDLNEVSSGRIELWTASFDQFLSAPWFGSGPDAYLLSRCCETSTSHAHNFVLQGFMEFGVVGCILLFALIVTATRLAGGAKQVVHAALATEQNKVLTAMVAALCCYSMVDGTYYWLLPLFHTIVYLGLWCAAIRNPAGAGKPASELLLS